MTYDEFIQDILNKRGRFACGDEYHERHHIIPKCMGGTNDEENLIDLYAREHYVAHKLLAQANPDCTKLWYALWNMANIKGSAKKREEITPDEYERLRKSKKNLSVNLIDNTPKQTYGVGAEFFQRKQNKRLLKAI